MPSINIPPKTTRRWTGNYPGNYYGTFWKTFNVDFDRIDGSVMLSRRMQRIEDSDEIASNQMATFIRTTADSTDRYWACADGGGLFKTDSAQPENSILPSADWDLDGLANTPSPCRDMTVHGNDSRNDSGKNKLFVTLDSGDIAVLNDTGNSLWTASWWETKHSQNSMDTNVIFRPIQYFPFRKITLVGDGNLIHTISRPSDTQNDTLTNSRLVLPKDLNARYIFTTPNRAWICCNHRFGGEGAIVEWDGFSETYNHIHRAYGMTALSGVDYNGNPIVLNNRGNFLEYTGNGFKPMIRNSQEVALPSINDVGSSIASGTDTSVETSVFPRGMTTGEDGMIYINAAQSSIPSQRYGGGIYSLNPQTGRIYSKHSLGAWGDSVDYGQQQLFGIGGLEWVPSAVTSRNLLAGGILNTTDTAGDGNGIWLLESDASVTATRGHFVTQYIPSDDIKDFWDTLWIRFRRFITTGNTIVVKGRGVSPLFLANRRPLRGVVTWTSTTTFTITLASADDVLAVGDEIEVLNGPNAGYLAHITIITGSHSALQTITIDETVTTGSSTSAVHFQRWKKVGTITSETVYEKFVNVGIDSSFIQFKIEMRGPAAEMEISELVTTYRPSLKLDKI